MEAHCTLMKIYPHFTGLEAFDVPPCSVCVIQSPDMPLGARTVSRQFCLQLMSFSACKYLLNNSDPMQGLRMHEL